MSYALDLMDVGHYYGQYLRLMAHWKALFSGAILDSSYDELVVDPRRVMERVQAFLGLHRSRSDICSAACAGRPPRQASLRSR